MFCSPTGLLISNLLKRVPFTLCTGGILCYQLKPPPEHFNIEVDNCVHEITQRMSQAWEAAQVNVKKAQKRQKYYHDQKAKEPRITEVDRVFLFDPDKKVGKADKFARPCI